MTTRKITTTLILGTMLLLLGATQVLAFSKGKEPPVLPDDILDLLPAKIDLLVATESLAALDDQLFFLLNDPGNPDTDIHDRMVTNLLAEALPVATDAIDRQRPLAMALRIPTLLVAKEPRIVLVLPVTGTPDTTGLKAETYFDTATRKGSYMAFTSDVAYQAGDTRSPLALDFPLKLVAMRTDLKQFITTLRPLAEMGLGGLVMGASMQADTSEDTPETTEPDTPQSMMQNMSVEQAQALADLIRSLMDSLDKMELGLDEIDGQLTANATLTVLPDSPLSPGPQPSFKEALELTRLLPHDQDLIQVSALSKVKQFGQFMEFYRLNMEQSVADLDPAAGQAFRDWYERYLDVVELTFQPYVATSNFDREGISGTSILATADPEAALADLSDVMDAYPDLGAGVTVDRAASIDLAGREVRTWQVNLDEQKLAETVTAAGADQNDPVQSMTKLLRALVPTLYLYADDAHVVASAARNTDALAAVVRATGQRRAAVDPRVARAAAEAGDHCQQIVLGDLSALIEWAAVFAMEIATSDLEIYWPEGTELPFVQTLCVDNTLYDLNFSTPAEALQETIRAVRRWKW